MSDPDQQWIGVDLDRTLAVFHQWEGNHVIGAPIAPMVKRVRNWLQQGRKVKIFTARCFDPDTGAPIPAGVAAIQSWCALHLGAVLPVTNRKDTNCITYFDDIAVQVEANTGRLL